MHLMMQRSTVAVASLMLLAATSCAPDGETPGSAVPGTAPTAPTLSAPGSEAVPAPTLEPAPGLLSADLELPTVALGLVTILDAPMDTTVLADGTVLVAERAGRVRVLITASGAPGGSGPAPTAAGDLLLDVSGRTTTDGERGLLSIAAGPDGSELFLSLTDPDGDTLVEAHPLDGPRVTGPPRTIYTLAQPRANHNGGPIVFTPEGFLLVGLGDGGGSGDPQGAGQDLRTPLGAVIRLDVSGAGPGLAAPDNPFVDRADAAPEIAAYGLRNPWRMSLDAARGEL